MECSIPDSPSNTEAPVDIDYHIRGAFTGGSSEIHKCCRLCAIPSDGTVHIFGVEGLAMELADKINAMLPIQVSETMECPVQVCRKCIVNLDSMAHFIEGVKEAQKKIKILQGCMTQPRSPCGGFKVQPISCPLTKHEISKHTDEVALLSHGGQKNSTVINCAAVEPPVLKPWKNVGSEEMDNTEHACSTDDCHDSDMETLCNECPGQLDQFPTLPCPSYLPNDTIREENTCRYCNTSFKWKSDHLSHEIMAHPDVVFYCQVCFKVFYDDKAKFRDHQRTHPKSNASVSSNKADEIPICDKTGVMGNTGNGSLCSNAGKASSGGYACKYCNLKCTTMGDLFTHQTTFHPRFVFRCKVCLKVFYENVYDYRQHEDEHVTLLRIYESQKHLPQHPLGKRTMYSHMTAKQKEWMRRVLGVGEDEGVGSTSSPVGSIQAGDGSAKTFRKGNALPFKRSHCSYCILCQLKFNSAKERDIHCDFHHNLRHPCRFCPLTFRDKAQLMEHEESHQGKPKHKCKKCSETFENIDDYHKHKAFNHVSLPRYSCEICKRLYVRESELSKHMKKEHLRMRPFLCEKCGMCFESRSTLQSHTVTHRKNQETLKIYNCHLCRKTFKDKSNLKDHVSSHTANNSSHTVQTSEEDLMKHYSHLSGAKFACPLCGIIFNHRLNMLTHLKRHDEIRCLVCREQFADVQLLLDHQRAVHPDEALAEFSTLEGEGSIRITAAPKCEECSKYFASELSLKVHQKEKHILIEEPFWCDLCLEKYKEKSALMDHVANQHPGKTLFHCFHCPCIFLCQENKVQHEQGHAEVTSLNTCQECGESFQTVSALSKHSVTMHPSFNKDSFDCDTCNKTFSCKTFLVAHQQSHDIKQRFSCPICHRSFRNLKTVKCHEKTHFEGQNRNLVADGVTEDILAASLISSDHFHGEGFDKVEQEVVYTTDNIVDYSEVIFVSDKLI